MKYTIYSLVCLLFLTGCYRDSEKIVDEVIIEKPEVVIQEAKVVGKIMNENGSLLGSVDIAFNGKTNSGSQAYFYFEADNIRKYNEILTFQHYTGMELSIPLINIENTINYHNIYLPSTFDSYTWDRDNDLNIEIKKDLNISISAGAIEKDGGMWDNNTPIVVKHLDPGRERELRLIPGFLAESGLYRHSYLNIEDAFILGLERTELQTLEFQHDKISISTDEDIYFFDPGIGMWKEIDDQFDYKVGYYATGSISNSNFIELDINASKQIEGLSVKYKLDKQSRIQKRIASNNQVIVHAPTGSSFENDIINQFESIQTDVISTDDLKTSIDLTVNEEMLKEIKADLRNCDDNKESEGFVILRLIGDESIHYYQSESSLYILDNDHFNALFSVYNKDFTHKTSYLTLKVKPELNLGRQYFCDAIDDEYLVFNIEGFHKIHTEISYAIIDDVTMITGTDDQEAKLSLRFEHQGVGMVEDEKANILLEDELLGGGYKLNCFTTDIGCGFEEILITNYSEEDGTFVKGKFKGTFWIESIDQENAGYRFLNGEFQFRR